MSKEVKSFRFEDPEMIKRLDKLVNFENKFTNGTPKFTRTQYVRLLIIYAESLKNQGVSIAKMQINGEKLVTNL